MTIAGSKYQALTNGINLKLFLAICAVFVLLCDFAQAQQAGRVYRVGYLWPTRMEQGQSRRDAFEAAMRNHGYVAGKNLVVEYRWADGKFAGCLN